MPPLSDSFNRGSFSFDAEHGIATIAGGLYTIFPYAQPQPYFVLRGADGSSTRLTTDGVKMLSDAANGTSTPYLIRAGYGLLASLLIAPDGLKVWEVQDMQLNRGGEQHVMPVAGPRLGLAAASAISFSTFYRKRLSFHPIDELPTELPS